MEEEQEGIRKSWGAEGIIKATSFSAFTRKLFKTHWQPLSQKTVVYLAVFYIHIMYVHVVPLAAIMKQLYVVDGTGYTWYIHLSIHINIYIYIYISCYTCCVILLPLMESKFNSVLENPLCPQLCLFLRKCWAVSSFWHLLFIDPGPCCLPLHEEGGNLTACVQALLPCTPV